MRLLLALFAAGISFPAMFWVEGKRALPYWPPPERMQWDANRSFFHNLKDDAVEVVRFDVQYWTKAFCFIIVMLLLLNALQWWIARERH
jgi:hypothetical protein